jgi:alkylhydroperoxidase family enzyme
MSRVPPITEDQAEPAAKEELQRQRLAHGRVTNMKLTLAHSPLALGALMQWYPLHDAVAGFLGPRATILFVHSISTQTDCLICSTFFRRMLIERGENPDALELSDREKTIVEYGRQLATGSNNISNELHARLASFLSPRQIVELTAFGGLMIATNVFNNAIGVELDEYLYPFRKIGDGPGA